MMNKPTNEQPISRRILVLHHRAITQLIEIRGRAQCGRFANLAAMAARAKRRAVQPLCRKGAAA